MNTWRPNNAPMTYFSPKGKQLFGWLHSWIDENAVQQAKPLHSLIDTPQIKALIIGTAANSPYLCQLIEKFPLFLFEIFKSGPDKCLAELIETTNYEANSQTTSAGLKKTLRQNKSRLALLTALADLGGHWTLHQVTTALSQYADLALNNSVAHLLAQAVQKGQFSCPDCFIPDDFNNPLQTNLKSKLALQENCGYVLLALGKLGGNELNYSSDIDLIALYDDENTAYIGKHSASEFYVKLTRDIIDIISKRSADGYVFRCDFRLRPDPGATPLAISLNAAEVYYQSIGQNWERSAMIKARATAGDQNVGADFIERMQPFIWRRNLDFAAIADIHAIKSQLHAFHSHEEIALKGHDVKIGYGGIREIEFLAQIQQLIYGGRAPEIRLSSTIPTLQALTKFGKLTPQTLDELSQAYGFLRTVEHRLQMINDEQTHQIPNDDEALTQLAAFLSFKNVGDMEIKILATMHLVAKHFAEVSGAEVTEANDQLAPIDPVQSLKKYGFENPKDSAEIITSWRTGRYRALKSERARGLLEKSLPKLLAAFAKTSNPLQALLRFDDFLVKLPTGVQLFSLFDANPWLFKLIAKIMGSAPLLADQLARQPALLDTLLDPQFFNNLPEKKSLQASLDQHLSQTHDYQDFLEVIRQWLNDRRFEIGVHILEGTANSDVGETVLSNLADIVLSGLIPRVESDFKAKFGYFPTGSFIVLAMGSYGFEKLTFTSDLDMVFLYDLEGNDESSTIEDNSEQRSLTPSKYFSRLGQHIITAISARSASGALYELDMRLRPSGKSGPLVVASQTFEDYQNNEAWTWEHMALTKARVVYGNKTIKNKILSIISNVLLKEKNQQKILDDVQEMHQKIIENSASTNIWNLRNIKGGFVDIEFILQYLILLHAPSHSQLLERQTIRSDIKTIKCLSQLELLDKAHAETLSTALKLYRSIHSILRLSYGENPNEVEFSTEICDLLTEQCGETSFNNLKTKLEQTVALVYGVYQHIIDKEIAS